MYTLYPNPSPEQRETVRKLYQSEQQVINSTTKEELNDIVKKILNCIENTPTAEIHLHDGRILNSDVSKQNFVEILKKDVDYYEDFNDAQVGLILTIDLLMGVFVLDRRKRPN